MTIEVFHKIQNKQYFQSKLNFDKMVPFLFFASLCFYSLQGFNSALIDDSSVVYFAGKGIVEGLVPYHDIFLIKGPFHFFLSAFGIRIGESTGMPEIQSARLLFALFAALSAVAIYTLSRDMTRCRWVGFLAFLTLLSYYTFAYHISTGPRPKIPIVLFESLCLLNILHRRWFWVGIYSSLSALTWQPMGIFCLTSLLFAIFSSEISYERIKAFFQVSIGILIPLLFFICFFFTKNVLRSFLDGFLYIHISGVNNRTAVSIQGFLRFFFKHLGSNILFQFSYIYIFVHFFLRKILIEYIYKRYYSFWQDSFTPIFLTTIGLTLWSIVDYQGPPDSFAFLPHLSVALSIFIYEMVKFVKYRLTLINGDIYSKYIYIFASLLLIIFGCYPVYKKANISINNRVSLDEQKRYNLEILKTYGNKIRIICAGKMMAPCIFTKLHSHNRYPFIDSGIDLYMEQMEHGGFEGWLKRIQRYDPHIVFFEKAGGKKTYKFKDWLKNSYSRIPGKPRGSIYIKKNE